MLPSMNLVAPSPEWEEEHQRLEDALDEAVRALAAHIVDHLPFESNGASTCADVDVSSKHKAHVCIRIQEREETVQ